MTKIYELINHTADFGIHVFGKNLGELFANAAFALFDLVADVSALKGENQMKITVSGLDWPDLMVNWLRELLYLWTGSEFLLKTVKIQEIKAYEISATLCYDTYDPGRHVIRNEIKAVTYHQIQVTAEPAGWEARIIIDV